MNIFDFPMKDFNYLLANVGKQIAINGTATKALIGHNTKPNLTADYRYISTLQQTHRGDLIKWDNANWLVLSEVAQKVYSYYYKAEIRKCNWLTLTQANILICLRVR